MSAISFCSILGRVKERGERRSGVLWKEKESLFSLLGCSPSVLDAALLAPPLLSCYIWNALCSLQLVLLGLSVHKMPWAVVCPDFPCTCVCKLFACAHNMRTSSMLDLHQFGKTKSEFSRLLVLQR